MQIIIVVVLAYLFVRKVKGAFVPSDVESVNNANTTKESVNKMKNDKTVVISMTEDVKDLLQTKEEAKELIVNAIEEDNFQDALDMIQLWAETEKKLRIEAKKQAKKPAKKSNKVESVAYKAGNVVGSLIGGARDAIAKR